MHLIFVGTYTPKEDPAGIYALSLNKGRLSFLFKCGSNPNPSFLATRGDTLYAVGELETGGHVSAYRIHDDGSLAMLNNLDTEGKETCHVAVNSKRSLLYATNYGSGNVIGAHLNPDGSIGEAIPMRSHTGASINLTRQEGPHTHSVTFSPDETNLIAADLGIDKLMRYSIDENGELQDYMPQPVIELPLGDGPRHFAFHPNGKMAALVTELKSRLYTFSYDGEILRQKQQFSTLPKDYTGDDNLAADLHFTPDGRFLYVSNRGHDSLALYEVDQEWNLVPMGFTPCGGTNPRNFCIDPTGEYLLVANECSDSIIVYQIDKASGKLTQTDEMSIPKPSCLICHRY